MPRESRHVQFKELLFISIANYDERTYSTLPLLLQDCDMPEALKVPEVRPHEYVDVAAFLHLKRAKNIGKEVEDDDSAGSKP